MVIVNSKIDAESDILMKSVKMKIVKYECVIRDIQKSVDTIQFMDISNSSHVHINMYDVQIEDLVAPWTLLKIPLNKVEQRLTN